MFCSEQFHLCACFFVSYFEVGGGTNFVTFSSASTHITFMSASTDSVTGVCFPRTCVNILKKERSATSNI